MFRYVSPVVILTSLLLFSLGGFCELRAGALTVAGCDYHDYWGTTSSSCAVGKGWASATSVGPALGAQSHISFLFDHTVPYGIGAGAQYTDTVTLSGPYATVLWTMVFQVSGSYSSSGMPAPFVAFGWDPDGAGSAYAGTSWQGAAAAGTHTASYVLPTGVPLPFMFQLMVGSYGTEARFAGNSADADFSHTALLIGAAITQVSGAPALGVTYNTAGGTPLPLQTQLEGAQFVPEPSTFLLVVGGAVLLLGARRRI
jgi:hypothetical protein